MNKHLKLITLLISIIIILYLTITITFAKIKMSNRLKSLIGVAKPIIEIENQSEEGLEITESTNNCNCYFKVMNYNKSDEISQITQQYTIKIITKNEETLNEIQYSLYLTNENHSEERKIELSNNKTQKITIPANQKQEDYYKLKIDNIKCTQDINDSISIKVDSESIEL